MKKLFLTIAIGVLFASSASASLWSYYTSRGEQLPPLSERAIIAESCGITDYIGSYDQNILLEDCLTSKKLGIAIPNISALFETSLQNSVSEYATSMTLVSATLKNGNTLSGLYGFIIDEGNANEEFVICQASSTALTSCLRGIDPVDGKTEVATLKESHRRSASVKITDYPILGIMRRVLNGQEGIPNALYYDTNIDFTSASSSWLTTKGYVDNRNGYYEAPVANFAALPTGVNQGEMRVTLDDGKVYTWSGSTWILAGAGGGAGTVYRDDIVATSTNRTYSLSSGSYPDKKYLQVFLNGSLLSEGASADYQASTTGNSITLNFDPVVGEVITLRVESIDFYNAEWVNVNTDLLPDVDNTHDIGSSSLQFKDLYLGGNANISGALTVAGMTTLNSLTTTTLTTTTINGLLTLNSSVNNLITVGATSSAGSLQTITHGLGRVPAKFTFNFQGTTDGGYVGSSGVSDTTNNYCVGVGSTGSSGYVPINISESIYSIYYRRYNTYTLGRVTSSNATTFTIEWVQNGASIPFVWTAQ